MNKKSTKTPKFRLSQGKDYDILELLTNAFKSFGKLYPSFSQFIQYLKDKEGQDFIYQYRSFIIKWYFAQEVVQVFQPPAMKNSGPLSRKKGYYPKIISFYPFERLYADLGKIKIYPFSKTRAMKIKNASELAEYLDESPKEIVKEFAVGTVSEKLSKEVVDVSEKLIDNKYKEVDGIFIPKDIQFKDKKGNLSDSEYIANLKKSGEAKFPPELRHVYLFSGIKKTGSTGANVMSQELKDKRKKFLKE